MNAASIASSGLRASMLRMDVAGHNIANAQTPGMRRQAAVSEALPGGGVTVHITQAAVPGAALAEDIVAQMAASHAFKANMLTLHASRDMLGSLLDVHA